MARDLDYVAGMMQWNLNYQLAVPQTDEKWGFGIIRDDWSPGRRTTRWRRCQSRKFLPEYVLSARHTLSQDSTFFREMIL